MLFGWKRLLVNGTPPQCQLEVEDVKEFVRGNLEDYENLFNNLENFITMFKVQIIAQFIPFAQEMTTKKYAPERSPLMEPTRTGRSGFEMGYPTPIPSFGVGGQDLYPPSPFQGNDPFRSGQSGNLIGPQHPGFGVNDPFRPFAPPPGRPVPGIPPPGARFDPYGPPGTNFPFGPDPDHLPPPGGFGSGFGGSGYGGGFGGGIL